MRRISAQIEALGPASFVLLIALVAGGILGIPSILLVGVNGGRLQVVPFLVVGLAAVLRWTAALLLWLIAVRRVQSSAWMTAAQVTLGLVVAHMLAASLSMVGASIETHGEVASIIAQQPLNVIVSNLGVALFPSPLWFFGSAIAIALGRHLNVGSTHRPASAPTATQPER